MSSLADLFAAENKEKFARKESFLASVPANAVKKRTAPKPDEVTTKKKKQRTMSRAESRALRAKAREEEEAKIGSFSNVQLNDLDAVELDDEVDGENEASVEKSENSVEESEENDDDASKRTIFAGNIPLSETKASLMKYFSATFGPVAAIRLRSVPVAGTKVEEKGDINTVKKVCANSRKFGDQKGSFNAYIVFKSVETALKAVEFQRTKHNHGIIMGNRHIRLDTIDPPTLFDPKRTVFLGNLPSYVDEEDLRSHFVKVMPNGQLDIEGVRIIRDQETLIGKGIAYMLFSTRDCVIHALGLHDSVYRKRNIRVTSCGKRSKNLMKKKVRSDVDGTTAMEVMTNDEKESKGKKNSSDEAKTHVVTETELNTKTKATFFNAANALKRIKSKTSTKTRKQTLIKNNQQKDKANKGRKGKRLGGVVKRALKAQSASTKSNRMASLGKANKNSKKKPVQ